MNAKDRAEAAKWLRLGYETYGPDGVASLAGVMGLSPLDGVAFTRHVEGDAIAVNDPASTTTSGSDIPPSSEWSSPGHKFRYGGTPKRPPRACPTMPPRHDPAWRRYDGNSSWFHCGFEGFLENRKPSVDWPIGECFYDRSGRLVDDDHPYAGCKGTPDQFEASDIWGHTVIDKGGIVWRGIPAGLETLRHYFFNDEQDRWEEQSRRYRRRR